jgi:Cytochrome C assembly protein
VEDIERQIERWRRGLPASLAGRPDVIDELEGHLRDELARLVAGGVPADEAWAKAVERLGTPDALAAEFAKVPPARWLPGTVVPAVFLVAGLGVGGLIASRVWGREAGPLLAIHVLTVTWGYLAALAAGALAVWVVAEGAYRGDGRRGMAAFRRPASGLAWASLSMTAVGVVLGAVWASGRLGRAWDWDPREVGGLGVLLCAGLSAVVVRLNARAGMAAAIAGSTAAVLAWFVPPLLETGGASGVGLGVVLGTVVGGQLVLMALAVAHPRAWGMADLA